MKISTRIIISVTLSTAILVFLIIGFIANQSIKIQRETALSDLKNTSHHLASTVDAELEIPMDAARTMAQMFEKINSIPVELRRSVMNSQLQNVLLQNPNFFGVWTCWEPNALDGIDSKFANKDGHDQTGRFVPYWFKKENTPFVEPLKDYTMEGLGDYYLLAKKSKSEVILNPYTYNAGGKTIMMTSLVVPIKIDGNFVGVVGIDINIDYLQNLITKEKIYGKGYGFLVSNDLKVAVHPDTFYQRKLLIDYMDNENKQPFSKALIENKNFQYSYVSPITNEESLYLCAPLQIGKSTNYWMFVVSVPEKTILSGVYSIFMIALIGFFVCVIALGLISYFAGQSIGKNITKIISEVGKLIDASTQGKLSYRSNPVNVHPDFQAILTGLNEVLDTLVAPLHVAADYIEQISKGIIPLPITTNEYQGDFNVIKNNLNATINTLNTLTLEMNNFYKIQASGDFEYFMDDTQFNGVFKQVVQGYNQAVKLHVDNILGLLDIIGKYGEGNFDNKMPNLPGKQILATQIVNDVRERLLNVTSDIALLVQAATNQQFNIRADALKHKGEYQKIVAGTNNVLDLIVNKVYWYEQLLDAIPFPLSVTDLEMNWTFINLASTQVMGMKREEALGKKCHNWSADICKTRNCGIECLRRGDSSTFFTQPGIDKDFQVDVSYIYNQAGEKIGHIEVVQEISKVKRPVDYNKKEIFRLSENLKLIAQGNFEIDNNITPGSEFTQQDYQNFKLIYDSLNLAVCSIKALSDDINTVTNSVESGKLRTKADVSKHNGEYAKIIAGINGVLNAITLPLEQLIKGLMEFTKEIKAGNLNHRISNDNQIIAEFSIVTKSINDAIDSIIKPLNTASGYISQISKGIMPETIVEEYAGDFNQIKSSINGLININQQIIENTKSVALGDLTIQMKKRSQNDELIIAIEEMVSKLSESVVSINQAADNVASGSFEISNNSASMAQGANEQASSVEEISSAIEEMQATINQNADNARSTEVTALKAAGDIEIGSNSVQTTVEAMRTIIEKIQIITDIADKTDLLAINAAIEAARAGEHGEGFAVVAGEVRKLAEMSKDAAKEINQVSKNSLKTAEQSGKMLQDIVPQIKTTAKLVQEIAAASDEQYSGIQQINTAISQLNNLAQQNAASAEELSTGSEELTSLAETLRDIVSYFKLNNDFLRALQQKSNSYKQKNKANNTKKAYGVNIKLAEKVEEEFEQF